MGRTSVLPVRQPPRPHLCSDSPIGIGLRLLDQTHHPTSLTNLSVFQNCSFLPSKIGLSFKNGDNKCCRIKF